MGHGKAVTDKCHLPLPMGEVPEAERAIFTLSVGFAASSPSGGAKGETDCHVDPQGLLAMTCVVRWCPDEPAA